MSPTAAQQKAGAEAKAAKEKEDERKGKLEEQAAKKGKPLAPRLPDDAISEPTSATVSVTTVKDKNGDERVVAPVYSEWESAPVKSHPDEVEAHKKFLEKQKDKRTQRINEKGGK